MTDADHDMWFIYVFAPILVTLGAGLIKGLFKAAGSLNRMATTQEALSVQVTEIRADMGSMRESLVKLAEKLEFQQDQIRQIHERGCDMSMHRRHRDECR